MALLPVAEALARILEGAGPCSTETVSIGEAAGRVLAQPVIALRTQPPFAASAMDGYAVRAADVAAVPAHLRVLGTVAAGAVSQDEVGAGEAIRVFTGAPLPAGADAIAIQENVRSLGDGQIAVDQPVAAGRNVRRAGLDFSEGDALLPRGRLLDPAAVSLAAAANHARLTVWRTPLVAIIATGDELLPPGSTTGPGQIIASNGYGVAAIARQGGARVLDLGIAPDRVEAIAAKVRQAIVAGADVIVTLGGASVGDHDLVRDVLAGEGVELGFWKIAMRPGKPLMFGRLGSTRCLGLPGNPVASLVCSHLFLRPLVARLCGGDPLPGFREASLGAPLPANDLRQDYLRAEAELTPAGWVATPFGTQDSSMLRILAQANALIVREPFAPASDRGAPCRILMLR